MPAPIKDIGFDQIGVPEQNDTLSQDGVGGGGGVGLPSNGGGGVVDNPNPTITTTNTFIFNISSNQKSFVTTVNGEKVPNSKSVRISRESLAKENKIIRVSKEGYLNNEYYEVEMVNDGTPIIKNLNVSDTPLGITTKDIVLTKYVGGQVFGLPKSISGTTTNNIDFRFIQSDTDTPEEPSSYNIEFNISGEGAPVSVLKNGNKNAQFFPQAGTTKYEDVDGTTYVITSADTSLYRITEITITKPNNQPVVLKAESGETLETTLTLNSDYTISISTEKLEAPLAGLDPKITLLKTEARTYNINSKAGVPIMVQKNKDVQAITIIVGDDILEFDDLDDGDVIGLTIPHNVFEKIGQYKIKLFPFSFDDYETQIRDAEEPITLTPKEVTPKFVQKEKELPPPPPKPEDKFNPYKPIVGGSPSRGGGGGGRNEFIEREEFNDFGDRFDDFGRNDRPINDRNYR
jgi:hypothetical protein